MTTMKNPDESDPYIGEFEALLSQLTSSDDLINTLQVKIQDLRAEIAASLRDSNISSDDLQKIYAHLSEEKQNLIKWRKNVQSFMATKEVGEIQQLRALCHDRETKMKRIAQFDQYFKQVLQVMQSLQSTKFNFENRNYWKANELITKANELCFELEQKKQSLFPTTNAPNLELLDDFDFVTSKLRTDINILFEKFIYDLIQIYKENVSFENVSDCDHKIFRMSFLKSMSDSEYESYMKCLLQHKEQFKLYLRNTFDQINDNFLRYLIAEEKSTIFVKTNQDDPKESLVYNRAFDAIKLTTCDAAYQNNVVSDNKWLNNVQRFIESIIVLFTADRNVQCFSEIIKLIGDSWCDQIFTNVIKHHFETRIPRTESEFNDFTNLLEEGRKLQTFLQSIGMLEGNSVVLQNYIANNKEHFSAKISQGFLIRTKKSLKSNLNDLIDSDEALRDLKLSHKNKLPRLKVSCFMVDIKCIFEEMSAQLTLSSANLKLLLEETFSNVCELFVDISPFLFKVNIERNPRQNALFHNNCIFFGYLVECAISTHKPRLDLLAEFVPIVRSLASQIFLNQMQYQEKLLLSFLNESTFDNSLQTIAAEIPSTDLKISSQAHFEFRQCINNCLSHLNMLHMSFIDVLPEKICGRTFNTLIASFLTDFILSIVSLNDISSLGASHLSHELDYFGKELKLFLANSESLVNKWVKLNEINFILKSSLLEIVNRWADGNGLLANYLTADEVKHLIRALFQNNERRSNALSKIK